jgi:hypothetical protein
MKRRVLLWSLAFSASAIFFTSCRKDAVRNLSAEESRIYITKQDSTVNFSSFKTYSIVDSVGVIADNRLEGRMLTGFDAQVIQGIKAAMGQRGFTLVGKASRPDLGINVSRVTNTYTGVMSYRDYYGSYGSYYDPFYWGYGGYGYYPPTYSYGVYQIQEGGLSVEMLNLKDAPLNNNKIQTVWTALARGTGVFNAANASAEVNAFFTQSPYLKTSN